MAVLLLPSTVPPNQATRVPPFGVCTNVEAWQAGVGQIINSFLYRGPFFEGLFRGCTKLKPCRRTMPFYAAVCRKRAEEMYKKEKYKQCWFHTSLAECE